MSTEDRLNAIEESLQLVIEGVRALNEHQRVMQETLMESFRLLSEQTERLAVHQTETDEVLNRILRHLLGRSDNGSRE